MAGSRSGMMRNDNVGSPCVDWGLLARVDAFEFECLCRASEPTMESAG
jgi:hypothetical protein